MQRPISLLALALLAAASATVRAQNEGFNLDISDNDKSNLSLDELDELNEFDKGPSSGPFSNKPGWPNLDGPWDEDDKPESTKPFLTPVPSSQTPTPAPSSPTMTPATANNGNTNTPVPSATSTPSVAPASATPAPYLAVTDKPTTPAPTTTPSLLGEAEHIISDPTKADNQTTESDGAQCPQDSISVSVEGIPWAYCVSTLRPFCSREHPSGNCPGPQSGLATGSHCGIVKSGVYGCLPGPVTSAGGPAKCDVEA